VIDWLLSPLSGAPQHHLPAWTLWHARMMVFAWGVLLPLGSVLARFFKVLPGQDWPQQCDSKVWWHGHLALQGGGVFIMSLGALLALGRSNATDFLSTLHRILGWVLVGCGGVQTLSGFLRGTKGGPTEPTLRGDHYDMTLRRVVFERLHKSLGWSAVFLSVVGIASGLIVADAPRWMLVILGAWWWVLAATSILLQRSGHAIDTYQTIWGPDPRHPGNQRRPIGPGVHRRSPR